MAKDNQPEVDEQMSHAIHIVERKLKVHITEDYPLLKFFNQMEEITWYAEEERVQMEQERHR